MLRNHVYPTFGAVPVGDILPSQIQAWVKGRESKLKPSTIGVVHAYVSSIFSSAVADRRIVASPCASTKLPKVARNRVVPPTTDEVERLRLAVPDDVKAMVTLAAGTGMRQGELFGLTVDRIDFLRRKLTVDRQIVSTNSMSPTFGPPKTDSSNRDIPLPQVVVDALSAHLTEYPCEPHETVFRNRWGRPHSRSTFGHNVWQPALTKAGLPKGTTMHTLRHYYASLLIRHGESVKTVQARLGHASAAETLDTYSHLWPDSDDRTREAVDSVLGNLADSSRTDQTG